LRYHPGVYSKRNNAIHPALLAIGRNKAGELQSVQAIYLDKDSAKKAEVPVKKQTWGVLAGSSVDLSRPKSTLKTPARQTAPPLTYLAEGIETALSLTEALQHGEIKATLGKSNFAHPNLSKNTQQVVLCLDNDASTQSDHLIYKAAQNLIQQAKTVWIAKPSTSGQDYNDLLQASGSEAVKTNIAQAIPFADYRDVSKQPSQTLGDHLRALTSITLSEIKNEHSKSSPDKSLDNTTPHSTKSPSTSPLAKPGKSKDFEIEL
jgi:phage/plasmid primase-like uncharacterized protein